jgi:hypothetical protein
MTSAVEPPLKPRSRFWAEDADAPARPLLARAAQRPGDGGAAAPASGDASEPAKLTWQALLPPLAAIAIVIGVVLLLAMALR